MKIGIIGLGKMGSRIAKKLAKDHHVFVWNRSPEDVLELQKKAKVKSKKTIEELIKSLARPRVVWVMVPHIAVEEILTEVKKSISRGDIVIDGGNSFYKDTERRFKKFEKSGVHFLGIGVSGGILAGRHGYPLMVGGSEKAYQHIRPILDSLAKPNGGYAFFGTGGAGHFVKMVHNGVEYGMMQSIGEGFEILKKSGYKFNLPKVAKLWQKGTIVSGFLIDRAVESFENHPDLSRFSGAIPRSGEGDWTLDTAKKEKVKIPAIEAALNFRKKSETDKKLQSSITAKMVNALRHAFGGHPVRKSQGKEVKRKV